MSSLVEALADQLVLRSILELRVCALRYLITKHFFHSVFALNFITVAA